MWFTPLFAPLSHSDQKTVCVLRHESLSNAATSILGQFRTLRKTARRLHNLSKAKWSWVLRAAG